MTIETVQMQEVQHEVSLDHVEPQNHRDERIILGSRTEGSVSVETEDEVSVSVYVRDAFPSLHHDNSPVSVGDAFPSLHHDNSPEPDHGDVWLDWNTLIDEELRETNSDTMSMMSQESYSSFFEYYLIYEM